MLLAHGQTVFLVWAKYSTGDSFGHDGGQYELLEVHTDANTAHLRAEHFSKVTDYSVPWTGYFEHLDYVTVDSFVLGGG